MLGRPLGVVPHVPFLIFAGRRSLIQACVQSDLRGDWPRQSSDSAVCSGDGVPGTMFADESWGVRGELGADGRSVYGGGEV